MTDLLKAALLRRQTLRERYRLPFGELEKSYYRLWGNFRLKFAPEKVFESCRIGSARSWGNL
jgi:hypothetical protein